MKKPLVIVAVVLAVGLLMWLGYRQGRRVESATASTTTPAGALTPPPDLTARWRAIAAGKAGGIPPKPRLFKSKEYPPKSPEVQAMWEWWRAMDKADPSFQWKMPIEFYGIVLDQFDQPVAGVDVTMTWTTDGGTRTNRAKSGDDGKFNLLDAKGKRLVVTVLKLGYTRTTSGHQGFEYASFSDDYFHVPDSAKPVVFRLQKLIKPEPLYNYRLIRKIPLDGPPLWLDPGTGKTGSGDFSFGVSLGSGRGQYGSDYTLTIQANEGAGLSVSNKEFLFDAPESGYQGSISYSKLASNPNYNSTQKGRFYAKTSGGKYAAIDVEINVYERDREATLIVSIYYNPSGSRNLELLIRQLDSTSRRNVLCSAA